MAEANSLSRAAFQNNTLVYIPPSKPGGPPKWLSSRKCLWRGPKFLQCYVCLESIYSSKRTLFCDMLGIPDAHIKHLIYEAEHFQESDDLQYRAQVFQALDSVIRSQDTEEGGELRWKEVESLRLLKIFPIRRPETSAENSYDYVTGDQTDQAWFIADRVHLETNFRGVIPLLAFDVEKILSMDRLLQVLGFDDRKLSKAAKEIAVAEGPVQRHIEYTSLLRVKSVFIIRSVSPILQVRRQ
jgi:hypothetical protein